MRRISQIVPLERVDVKTYTVPTDFPELDGTLEWDHTTLVLVVAAGGGKQGIGYTYADSATATLIRETLSPILKGMDAMSPRELTWPCGNGYAILAVPEFVPWRSQPWIARSGT